MIQVTNSVVVSDSSDEELEQDEREQQRQQRVSIGLEEY